MIQDVKIKNLTIVIDGQEFTFTHKSVVPVEAYTPEKDPEVQGKGLSELEEPKVEPLKSKKKK